jgi:excisionase family DNA binding protein
MTDRQMPTPLAVTIKEGARLTGMSRTRIYELIGENRLEAVKAGRRTLLRMASLQDYMASLPRAEIRARPAPYSE